MKNMTRILAAILLLCTALTLCACVAADPTAAPTTKPQAAPTDAPKPTETDPLPTTDGKVEYSVTVLYPDGTPAANVPVQICTPDGMCYIPVTTDETGVMIYRLVEKQGYKARIASKVEGYKEWGLEEYQYFEGDSKTMTITLVAE